jgi:hypothetical protein
MADANGTTAQLAATRAAASDSTDRANAVLNAEIAKPISDPAVMGACADIVAKNGTTISQCDQHIVTAILARADADTWLNTLNGLTTQMAAQTAQLQANIKTLNNAKAVATAIAGMLSLI